MNLYRFLAYFCILVLVVVLITLGSIIAAMVGGQPLMPENHTGLWVLILVLLLLVLVIWILLCLARAKDRLRDRKTEYQRAHAEGRPETLATRGTGLGERLTKLFDIPKVDCRGICDVLVRKKFPRKCIEMPIKVTRRPDPCIYSQFFLMDNNQPVTWDNPDVIIELGGNVQDTYNLDASTTYDVTVFTKNNSPFFDALGTHIQVNMLQFGIGAPGPTSLHTYTKDIPFATVDHSIGETFTWTTPPDAGHFCLQVLITHGNDVNPGNNEGWNNTEVKIVAPGETFARPIPVWNLRRFERPGKERQNAAMRKLLSAVTIDLDSYVLPTLDPADPDLDVLFAATPAQWDAKVTPTNMTIEPLSNHETTATFEVTVPADAAPGTRATFNVTGRAGGWPLGGVTFHLIVQS